MYIAVDFDGTCVTHEYPKVGEDIGAEIVLKALAEKGHRLILYTMRSGDGIKDALAWFEKYEIPVWAINMNPTQKSWTASSKVYAHLYIDDAAIGIPLTKKNHADTDERPFVDWYSTVMCLQDRGVFGDIEEAKEILAELEEKYPKLYDPSVLYGLNF